MESLSEAAAARLTAIEHDLEQSWLRYPQIPHPVRMHMAIAVAEIVGNIVEHGGALRRPVEINMEFALSETGQVHIRLVDDGDELPADVDLSTVRMPDPTAERGRGLPLARAVLEQLSYDRRNAINCWTLISRVFTPLPAIELAEKPPPLEFADEAAAG